MNLCGPPYPWPVLQVRCYAAERGSQPLAPAAPSAANGAKIDLIAADGNLERDDLVEMVHAGLVPYTVTPSFTAQLWKNVFTDLKVYEAFPVTDKTESGWAVRKDSPKLRAMLEEFASTHREGTAYFAQLANTYLKSGRFIKNNENAESVKRFNQMKGLFQKYASEYQFPWMLIAAEAYQESGLNQEAKSASRSNRRDAGHARDCSKFAG